MQIQGKLRSGSWLVKMKRNEIAKLVGFNQDSQINPEIEVGQNYSISGRWNLLKILRSRKKRLQDIGTEITDLSNDI